MSEESVSIIQMIDNENQVAFSVDRLLWYRASVTGKTDSPLEVRVREK